MQSLLQAKHIDNLKYQVFQVQSLHYTHRFLFWGAVHYYCKNGGGGGGAVIDR